MNTSDQLIEMAIKLLKERRWPMVPSRGLEKKPCVAWRRFQNELPKIEQLRQWGRQFRPDRWGLVTGRLAGVVIVDFDGDAGIDLMRAWDINPHVRTGSGGFHWYTTHPGWPVPTLNAKTSKNSWPWPGVDIRGDGGFAVLLGRNSNGPYEQLRDLIPEPFDILPAEVVTFLRNHQASANELNPFVTAPRLPNAQGKRVDSQLLIDKALSLAAGAGRNNAGFWAACQLRDNGYTMTEAEAAMLRFRARAGHTNTQGKPEPYTERDVNASLKQAYSRSARDPWKQSESHPHGGVALAMPLAEQRNHLTADDPVNLDIYVDHTGDPLVVHTGEPLLRARFARIPTEVLSDRRLNSVDIRVYGALAEAHWTGSATVGTRWLAKRANHARRLVVESLKRLVAAGHIQKAPKRRGERGQYMLLSPVFLQKNPTSRSISAPREDVPAPTISRRQPRNEVISMPRRTGQR